MIWLLPVPWIPNGNRAIRFRQRAMRIAGAHLAMGNTCPPVLTTRMNLREVHFLGSAGFLVPWSALIAK